MGTTHIRYCGLKTRLVQTITSRHSVRARPNAIRPLSCCQYTQRHPPTSATSASRLSSLAALPIRLYEWKEWLGAMQPHEAAQPEHRGGDGLDLERPAGVVEEGSEPAA